MCIRDSAIADQRGDARFGLPQQFGFIGLAYRTYGGEDAAAGARDVLVARTLKTQLEFRGAIASKHRMLSLIHI